MTFIPSSISISFCYYVRMTHFDPIKMKDLLLKRREEVLSESDMASTSRDTVELDQTKVGRLSRMDAMQNQAMAQATERRRQIELVRIDAALERMESDEYGFCVDCGEEISPQRLELDPAVPICIQCANKSS
jgi:DnaK suppressor protein